MAARYDAIIIGGGVAGSSCAILLAQAGWSVALVEKQEFPRRKVCGECIAASNLVLLDTLGIGEKFRAIAGPELRRVAWCSGDTTIQAALPQLAQDVGSRYPWGRALGREHLDTLLLDRARELGATILQPYTARTVEHVDGRHRCVVIDGAGGEQSIETDVLIDAHGSWQHGPLTTTAYRRRTRASDLFAFKANFSSAHLEDGVLPVLAFAGGYGGMVQADHGLLTLACCVRRDRLQHWRAQHRGVAAGEAVQTMLEGEIHAVRDALRGARREGAWLAVGPIWPRTSNPRGAEGEQNKGVYAVGNAAGEAHPILGEGISMAIQSAFLLCERLVGGSQDVASSYAIAWRRAFAPRIRLAAVYAHVAMNPAANRALLPLLRHWPQLMATAARWGGKAHCAVDARRFTARGPARTNT